MNDPKKDNTKAGAGGQPESADDRNRKRSEAAAAKISPAVPPAGAAVLADADPALDTESETKESLKRASGRDRLSGEQ
jgi:hypothetical protein